MHHKIHMAIALQVARFKRTFTSEHTRITAANGGAPAQPADFVAATKTLCADLKLD